MLKVGNKLESFEVGAGEPFILSVQFRDAQNEALDMTDRRVVLSFYKTSGRGLFDSIDGVPVGIGLMQFVRAGEFTETLSGQGLTVSLSERLLQGRETLATGTLKVNPTANPVESYGPLIGRAEVRATVYLDNLGSVTKWGDLMRLPYASDGAPVITSPAGINSDGTPQVGETFTGVDPVGNGPVVARRWIAGGSTVATTQTYTAQAAGSLRYEADIRGPDNTTATSWSTITVAGLAVTLGALSLSGTPKLGVTSNGTINGATSGSTITDTLLGLTINSAARTYSFDGTGTAGTFSNGLVETHPNATNSGRESAVTIAPADTSSNQMTAGGESMTAGGEPMTAGAY